MGKRYLFFFTIFFVAGLSFMMVVEHEEIPWILLCTVVSGVFLFGIISRRILMALFCGIGFISSILFCLGYTNLFVEPLYDLENETLLISAEICDYPELYEDSQRVEIVVDAESSGIEYIKSGFRTLIYLPLTDISLNPGDKICVTASFYIPSFSEGFDRQSYQASQGRFIQASSTGIQNNFVFKIEPCATQPLRYLPLYLANHWKGKIISSFEQREGGFMTSLLLGDRSEITEIDYQNLKKSGLSHIIAVSGMHLMILVAFVTRILGKRFGTIVSIPLVVFFAFMAGNTPSVMRAGIMVIAAAIAFLWMDETDSLTILALSLMLLLLHNPYSIASTSLQLSYLSTLGLMLYSARVQEFLDRPFVKLSSKMRKLVSIVTTSISCSLCAMLFTAPVLLYTFGYVTLISPLSNLLVLNIVSLAFVSGLIFCLIPALDFIFAPLVSVCSKYILTLADFSSDLWWLILDWNDSFAKIAVICSCLISIIIILNRHSKPKFTLPLLCVILILSIQQNAEKVQNRTVITIHAVGNGQMISVASGRESLSIIDCGSGSNRNAAEILNEYMLWNGYEEIDTMILTAVDKSHARALENVIAMVPIGQVILPNQLQDNEFTKASLSTLTEKGISYTCWDAAGETKFDLSGISCSLVGGTDRKLGIRLQTDSGDVLIMHSFTQKMMDDLLQKMPLCADKLILSTSNIEKPDLLESALEQIAPNEIIFSSGGDYVASKLYGISTRNTYLEGDIVFYLTRKME